MFPEAFRIGGFFQSTYGVLVTLGFLVGVWMASRLGRKAGLDSETVLNLGIYVALAALAGAKLLMILLDLGYYARNPGEIFTLTTFRAGGIFYGGLIAALITALVYVRRKHLPGLVTADVFAPAIALGHALGRLGCFAAGCCWGQESRLPWAVTFTNPLANQMFGTPLGVPLQPTQLYEAFAEAIIFLILYRRFHRPHRPGALIGLYLVLYSSVRFLVEFVRAHDQANPFYGPLVAEQWLALALVAAGVWLLRRPAQGKSQSAR
jgi:phosphatidylglycerol:prolipoprotein diacylglycerol transferase